MFLCPITHDVMVDPVVAADGETYERAAIEQWIRRGVAAGRVAMDGSPLVASPMCGEPLSSLGVTHNRALYRQIQEWRGH